MPSFTFQGFAAGTPVDLSATQGAASDSGSVPTWGQAGSGVLSLSAVTAPRIVAPAGVWLDASGVSGFGVSGPGAGETYDPRYHEITYIWDTDDSGVWSSPVNLPTEWNDKSKATGPRVCHTFDVPGTYSPSVWAIDDAGNTGLDSVPAITVQDPDNVYTGASTIVFSNQGGETWAGAPSGAVQVTSISGLQSAIFSSSGPTRILFKRGQTIDDVYLNIQTKEIEYIGAWGTGARPILKAQKYVSAPASWMFSYLNNSNIEQIVVTDLDMRSTWKPHGEVGWHGHPFWFVGIARDNVHITIHNTSFDGFGAVFTGIADGRPGTVIVSNSDVNNWKDYGFFVHRNSNADFRHGWVGCCVAQNPASLHGTSYQTWEVDGNTHGPIRFEAIGQTYIGSTDLFSCTGWSQIMPDLAVQPCLRINTFSDYCDAFTANIERCVMEGGYHVINMAGENGGRLEYPGNYLLDKLVLIGTAKSASASNSGIFVLAAFGGTTIRNVYGVLPNVAHHHDLGNTSANAISFFQDNPSGGNEDEPVAVYNCTFLNLRDAANDPGFAWTATVHDSHFNNLTIENNVVHAPDLDTPVDADAPLLSGSMAVIAPRFAGSLVGPDPINGALGSSVGHNSHFAVGYPSGTNQAYWQAIEATDVLHHLTIGTSNYWADNGDFDVDFTQSSEVRIFNRTGSTWGSGGAFEVRLDQTSAFSVPSTLSNPSTIPLPRPDTGSAAINSGDVGRKAYDDLLGSVRPATGNERGALLE